MGGEQGYDYTKEAIKEKQEKQRASNELKRIILKSENDPNSLTQDEIRTLRRHSAGGHKPHRQYRVRKEDISEE